MALYGCTSLVSGFKLTQKNDDLLSLRHLLFLRYRTLCMSILKYGFLTKGIELTWLILFKVLEMPQPWGTLVLTISVGTAQKFAEYKWSYGVRNFSVVGYVGETSYTFSAQGISLFLLATGRIQRETKDSDQSERLSFRE